jgi:hypothetical protein
MATTTPNFGWPVPTSTDLVKDGATAIEALGDSIDASLLDLKGGTTGQVLAKTTNTDMDFTWVAQDDSNAIQNSIVDAKGDLISATANDTPARLAVGSNGEALVADSSTATGLRYQSAYNGNGCINGGFDIWQRGTSFTSQYVYTADRWFRDNQPDRTFSRQASGLTDFQYSMRVQRNSGATGTAATGMTTSFETSESIKYQSQIVTLSFYAKAGANFSATSSLLPVNVYTGTGTDQRRDFGAGFTGEANPINTSVTLTTSWQRFSVTGTISSTATELAIMFFFTPTGTASTNDWFEITGVQLELGSVATTFKRAGGTIQGELAACQRYYYRWTTANGGSSVAYSNPVFSYSSTQSFGTMQFPVTMRTTPVSVETTGTASNYRVLIGGTATTCSGVPVYDQGNSYTIMMQFPVASGLTVGQSGVAGANNVSTAFLGFSAEL